MFRFVKHNFMKFASPVDPRTIALFLACALAFYTGMRFEMVNTQNVKIAWKNEQISTAAALHAALKDANAKIVLANNEVEKINVESNKREAKRSTEHANLLARYNAERMRVEALRSKGEDSASASSSQCPTTFAEGFVSYEAGNSIISLAAEADKYLDGFRDAQLYIKTIKDLCE